MVVDFVAREADPMLWLPDATAGLMGTIEMRPRSAQLLLLRKNLDVTEVKVIQ